jgi:hypothetical protein
MCFGQRPAEMPRKRMLDFYKQKLGTDSVKAEQVLEITLNYKADVTKVISNQQLSADDKSHRIKALIADKNRQLEAILTKAQQDYFIPITERSTSDTLKLTKTH